MTTFSSLAIDNPAQLCFGQAPTPLITRRGLHIGAGTVYPELNFTLPPMHIQSESIPEIQTMYEQILKDACSRALDLELEGLVFEFETLVEMTTIPSIAIDITRRMNDVLEDFYQQYGLKTAIRITPNDTREMDRPPMMRDGARLEQMLEAFAGCAQAGAEMLSIESTGGKEIHDDALLMCNLHEMIFGLIVMGCRDMAFLWQHICRIADETGTTAGGDTGCGFANTAMVLADKKYIPRVVAAADRVLCIVRSLVAYEQGARGPGKDCGYENPFLKAITGYPMSMEGKTAACAHLSVLGNIASATCDLWSNESIQNIKLLSGMAPTVCLEQLIYDCRLMNRSTKKGFQLQLRDLLVESDAWRDSQAFLFTPENIIRISGAIVRAANYYDAARQGLLEMVSIFHEAHESGVLRIEDRELPWLQRIENEVLALPESEEAFIDATLPMLDSSKFIATQYEL